MNIFFQLRKNSFYMCINVKSSIIKLIWRFVQHLVYRESNTHTYTHKMVLIPSYLHDLCRSDLCIILYIVIIATTIQFAVRETGRQPLFGHVLARWTIHTPSLHSKSGATKIPLPVALDSRNSRVPPSLALFLLSLRHHMGRTRIPFKVLQIIYICTGRPLSCVVRETRLSFKIPLKSAAAFFFVPRLLVLLVAH